MHKYLKFGAMIATSTVVMFVLMYFNVWSVWTMSIGARHVSTWRW